LKSFKRQINLFDLSKFIQKGILTLISYMLQANCLVPRPLVAYMATFGIQFFSLKFYHRQLFMEFVMLKTNK